MKVKLTNPVSDENGEDSEDENGEESFRVTRGGDWWNDALPAETSYRYDLFNPSFRFNFFGFRLVRNK